MPELFAAVQEEKEKPGEEPLLPTPLPRKFSRSASLCGDSPPNTSQFYEVLYLGRIRASHKRAPPSFIDDAVAKLAAREGGEGAGQPGQAPATPALAEVNHTMLLQVGLGTFSGLYFYP